MNFTPEVGTAEISDADLDNVSGGLAGASAGLVGSVSAGPVAAELCAEAYAVVSPAGVEAGTSVHAVAGL